MLPSANDQVAMTVAVNISSICYADAEAVPGGLAWSSISSRFGGWSRLFLLQIDRSLYSDGHVRSALNLTR